MTSDDHTTVNDLFCTVVTSSRSQPVGRSAFAEGRQCLGQEALVGHRSLGHFVVDRFGGPI